MINEIAARTILTVRLVLFIVMIGVAVVALIAATQSALAASLKSVSVVNGDRLTVGDIFDGAGRHADYVLGPAPQPGKDMVLDARTLYRIAAAMKLDWQPSSGADQVVVSRAATVVPVSQIETALRERLSAAALEGKFTMKFNGAIEPIVLPDGTDEHVEIAAMNFDPARDIFEASLVAPSRDNPLKRMNVSGQIERIVTVPVLSTSLRSGDVIGARDIGWIDVPARSLPRETLLKESDLIGHTPRRVAMAGKPLLANDIQPPTMVERGDTVTIIFQNGPLVLSTKGKALQTGARGDIIRVSNLSSNKTFDAQVNASREVIVQ